MRARVAVLAGLAAVVGAVLAPPVLWPERDSYPLSTYPMFASDRGTRSSLAVAVGIDRDGAVHRLSASEVSGTDEVMLAVQTVRRAVAGGRADDLCRAVAGRTRDGSLVAVEVRTEVVDSVGWLQGQREPESVTVHARCPVGP